MSGPEVVVRPPVWACDVVVVGAGVVGLACAERLSRAGLSVLVVERHAHFGQETSSRNSEVVHAGMYYPTGSVKARLCVAGRRMLLDWCAVRDVSVSLVGKYIIATSADEEAALDGILRRGRANGVESLDWVTGERIRSEEPRIRVTAGLWSPGTGIIDSHRFMASLAFAAREQGTEFVFQHAVEHVEKTQDGYVLTVRDTDGQRSELAAPVVVNAAGLGSDLLAEKAGIDIDAAGYRYTYYKGNYFRLRGTSPLRHLIYPVPPPGLAGLGIHVTIDLGGGWRLGPDVEVLPDRQEAYAVDEARRDTFFRAAARYIDGISPDDLSPDQSGIRPKLTPADGSIPDFVIRDEADRGLPGWIDLIGIESPGLTSSLAIANEVARLATRSS